MNPISLDTLCAALCYAAGIEAPAEAADANPQLCAYLDKMQAHIFEHHGFTVDREKITICGVCEKCSV